MCGIAGLTWPDRRAVERMTASLVHRGPDDSGIYVDEQVALGHRRLTIIDLTREGRQPMSDPTGTVWIVYNGEVYNFRELRERLEALGHAFRSHCDTEVVLHAYLEWGEDCVHELNGMFAFAVWDRRDRSLLLVRDRLGVKPLYYAVLRRPDSGEAGLVFGSELKAVLASGAVPPEVDPQSVYEFFGYEFVPGPRTIITGVRKLSPGHLLRFRDGEATLRRYWDLDMTPVERPPREHAELLREQLRRSTVMQMVADVPVGVFLSGGLDSSALVAFAAGAAQGQLDTFALGYSDATFSELEYARLVAERFGTNHRELLLEAITPGTISEVVWHLDEPMTDLSAAAFFVLCREVRRHVKVCISGEGGDESMAGYDRFKASKLDALYRRVPSFARERLIEPLVLGLRDRPEKKGPANMLKRFIEGSRLPEEGEHIRWQFFCPKQMEEDLFRPEVLAGVDRAPFAPVRELAARANAPDRLAREIYIDTKLNMVGGILTKVDKLSMAHGLEVRVPFLDHEYVQLCASIPSRYKLRGYSTKAIYREAMKGVLPERIISRGKQGYSLPVKNWLRGELKAFMHDTLTASPIIREFFRPDAIRRLMEEHDQYRANHSHNLWALINLSLWHDRFVAARWAASGAPPDVSRGVSEALERGVVT